MIDEILVVNVTEIRQVMHTFIVILNLQHINTFYKHVNLIEAINV